MRRMKHRVDRAMHCHYVQPWDHLIRRHQWRYVVHAVFCKQSLWPSLIAAWSPDEFVDAHAPFIAFRGAGRPRKRWDDLVNHFASNHFHVDRWTVAAGKPRAAITSDV